MSERVELSAAEMLMGAQAGLMRHLENVKQGRRMGVWGCDESLGWQWHIEGALAEMALAKHLGLYWRGKGDPGTPDVGGYDVRVTDKRNGSLILHDTDKDDRRYYLLTGKNGRYRVRGYILGEIGKQKRFWSDPVGGRAAYFIPQSELVL